MSTSPRARARPRIDSETTGSTMPGNSVIMSILIDERGDPEMAPTPPTFKAPRRSRGAPLSPNLAIAALQIEQSLRRTDHDAPGLQVDLPDDLRHGRDQVLALGAAHDPQVLRGRRLHAA